MILNSKSFEYDNKELYNILIYTDEDIHCYIQYIIMSKYVIVDRIHEL